MPPFQARGRYTKLLKARPLFQTLSYIRSFEIFAVGRGPNIYAVHFKRMELAHHFYRAMNDVLESNLESSHMPGSPGDRDPVHLNIISIPPKQDPSSSATYLQRHDNNI